MALGAGLNARGALEIVIASVGLSLGVFSETAYTVIVIVPLVTSVFAAVSLRLAVRDWMGSPAERERLEREQALSRNLVVRSSRLLLPSRAEPASIAAAQLMHFAWPVQVPATVISVTADSESGASYGSDGSTGDRWPDITVIRSVLDGRSVDHRQVRVASPAGAVVASAIVAEARLGYGAICVGVAGRHEGQLYSPMVDELLLHSSLPVVIVRRAEGLETPLPGAFTRVIVPVTGTRSSMGRPGGCLRCEWPTRHRGGPDPRGAAPTSPVSDAPRPSGSRQAGFPRARRGSQRVGATGG